MLQFSTDASWARFELKVRGFRTRLRHGVHLTCYRNHRACAAVEEIAGQLHIPLLTLLRPFACNLSHHWHCSEVSALNPLLDKMAQGQIRSFAFYSTSNTPQYSGANSYSHCRNILSILQDASFFCKSLMRRISVASVCFNGIGFLCLYLSRSVH